MSACRFILVMASWSSLAVPPTYANLGKSGCGFGLIKLHLKTKSKNRLEFTSSSSANTETTKVTGSLETKYRWTEYGLTFTEKWDTDNTLAARPPWKISFTSTWAAPWTSTSLGLAGYQMNFETAKSRVTQSNFAVGCKMDELQLHTNVNDGTEFGGSIYQKVNKKLETAVNLAWTAGNSNTRFGITAKYQIDPDACFSAKVNNSSLIGLGYTQTLKPGIKLTLSALAGGRKLGLGLEFDA
uniref:Non-selective voltage-gated ion channel VDAC1 n=1 Tax=Cavia porcellus TaxID=10141 RepID=H0VXJ2_CAVPO